MHPFLNKITCKINQYRSLKDILEVRVSRHMGVQEIENDWVI